MKTCTKCGEPKPLTEFGKHAISKDSYAHWCKECHKTKYREYAKTASGVYTAIKQRIKYYKTKPFHISREDFVNWYDSTTKQCEYCGVYEIELEKLGDSYNNKAHRLTIDCINNDAGYVKGNLVLACLRCNSIKSDFFTHDEMKELAITFILPKWEAILYER